MSERCAGCGAMHWDGVKLPNADLCKVSASSKVHRDCPQWLPAALRECLDRTTARALAAEDKLQRVRDWLKYQANSDGGIVAEIDAARPDRPVRAGARR